MAPSIGAVSSPILAAPTSSAPAIASSQGPSASSQRPSASSERPSVSSQQPSVSSERPSVSSQRPSASSERTCVTSAGPSASSEPTRVTSTGPSASSQRTCVTSAGAGVSSPPSWATGWAEDLRQYRTAQPPRQLGQAPANLYGVSGIGRRRGPSRSGAARFVIYGSGARLRLSGHPEGKVGRTGRNRGFDRSTRRAEECCNRAGHKHVSSAHREPFDGDTSRYGSMELSSITYVEGGLPKTINDKPLEHECPSGCPVSGKSHCAY